MRLHLACVAKIKPVQLVANLFSEKFSEASEDAEVAVDPHGAAVTLLHEERHATEIYFVDGIRLRVVFVAKGMQVRLCLQTNS